MMNPETWREGADLLTERFMCAGYVISHIAVELPGHSEYSHKDRYLMDISVSEAKEDEWDRTHIVSYFHSTNTMVIQDIEEQELVTAYHVDDESSSFIDRIEKELCQYIEENSG